MREKTDSPGKNGGIEIGYLVKDVAEILDCSREHVRRLYRRGLLQGHMEGKRLRLDTQSVRRYAGRHDRGQLELAVEWMALVDNREHAQRLAELLRRTFAFDRETVAEAIGVWSKKPGDSRAKRR